MKKLSILGVALLTVSGCTTLALEEYTAKQNMSSGNCRDRLVLDCLATIAANPNTLPSFALMPNGITTTTDNVSVGHTVTWAALKYTSEALAIGANRQPKGQWTVDPAVDYARLKALHAACLWIVVGPDVATRAYPGILESQSKYLDDQPHFNVAHRLEMFRPCWLHAGCLKDVPSNAWYKAHHGRTWVWVMPDDAEAFSQLVLVFQDIATLDIGVIYSPPILVQLTTYTATKVPDLSDKTKAATVSTTEWRAVKKEFKHAIEDAIQSGKVVEFTRADWLAYTNPWFGTRTAPGTPATSLLVRPGTSIQLPGISPVPEHPRPAPSLFNLQ
jgi:hypothetical protein